VTLNTYTFQADKPGGLLNMNSRPSHWDRAGGNAIWRDAAFWWAKKEHLRCRGAIGPVEIWVEFGTKYPDKRRDPSNFYPTVKAICDGFTHACVWGDDDSKHVHTNEPSFTNSIPARALQITLSWETE